MKLSNAVEGFLLHISASGYSTATIDLYTWAMDLMQQSLGDIEVSEIKTSDLTQFFHWLRTDYTPSRMNGSTKPLSGRSRENIWTAMRSFFNWAEAELDTGRPDQSIRRPQYEPAEIIPFSEEEVVRMLRACERTKTVDTERRRAFSMRRPTWRRDVALLFVLLDTGVRASECARLLVKDVNLDVGELHVRAHGTGRKTKARTIGLGKSVRKAIWRYLADRDHKPDDRLFVTNNDRPMNRSSILHLIKGIAENAGVPDAYPHRFRHTFAVWYLKSGGDVFTLQRALGHATLEMVNRYLAFVKDDLLGAHRRASPGDNLRY